MIKKAFLVFILFGSIRVNDAWGGRRCGNKERCIPLRQCPYMISLMESGTEQNVLIAENSICGYNYAYGFPLVCCPVQIKQTVEPRLGKNSEQLLPSSLCGRPATDDKIFGGSPAPIGGYPWMVAMAYKEPGTTTNNFLCSGSLINSRYILTAAHCVDKSSLGRNELAVIHLGDWNLKTEKDCQPMRTGEKCAPPHIVVKAEEIIIHPQYNTRADSSDDIALIRIDTTLDFKQTKSYIRPICLPPSGFNAKNFAGKRKMTAAGWGLTEHKNYSSILLRVNVPVTDEAKCLDRYKSRFVSKQLCIGGEGGADTCNGDSGAPLVIASRNGPPFIQVGIVSYGFFPCGLSKFPAVYTDVSQYRDWILQNMKP